MTNSERESAKRLITFLNKEEGRLLRMGRAYEAGTRNRWSRVVVRLMAETRGGAREEVQGESDRDRHAVRDHRS